MDGTLTAVPYSKNGLLQNHDQLKNKNPTMVVSGTEYWGTQKGANNY